MGMSGVDGTGAAAAQSKEPRFRTYASPQTGMSQAFMR